MVVDEHRCGNSDRLRDAKEQRYRRSPATVFDLLDVAGAASYPGREFVSCDVSIETGAPDRVSDDSVGSLFVREIALIIW